MLCKKKTEEKQQQSDGISLDSGDVKMCKNIC